MPPPIPARTYPRFASTDEPINGDAPSASASRGAEAAPEASSVPVPHVRQSEALKSIALVNGKRHRDLSPDKGSTPRETGNRIDPNVGDAATAVQDEELAAKQERDEIFVDVSTLLLPPKPRRGARDHVPPTGHRDDAPRLNYIEIQFAENRAAKSAKSAKSEAIYSTADASATAQLELAQQSLLPDAKRQLSNEISRVVQAFATSIKAGPVKKIIGNKEAYGANAAARNFARNLNAESFTRSIESVSMALIDLRQHTQKGLNEHIGKMAKEFTMAAIEGLTPDQKTVLARHMNDPRVLKGAVTAAEAETTTVAAATARHMVLKALIDAHAIRRSDGSAVPVR